MLHLILVIMLVTCSAWEATGAELSLVPSLTAREEYNDNINITVGARERAFVTTLSPALDVTGRTEKVDANVHLRLDSLFYSGGSTQDSLNQLYNGRVRYRTSERLSVTTEATYSLDSQADSNTQSTGMVTSSSKRTHQAYSVAGEYPLSEKSSASLSYAYGQDNYENQSLSDFSTHSAILGLSHDLGIFAGTTSVTAQFQYNRDLFALSTVENYSVSFGMNRSFSELWSLQLRLGGRYTYSELSSATSQETHQDWGGLGRVALSYTGETTSGDLTLSSDLQPSTSNQVSTATQQTSLTVGLRKNFTYELSGSMSLSYILNRSISEESNAASIDQDSLSFSPGLRYEFTRDVILEAMYQYTRITYNNTAQTADQNLFYLRGIFRYPMFW